MDVHRWSKRSLLWVAALVLAALTLGMAFAHTLELPQKMGYGPRLWATLNQTLYRYFAVVGGPVEVLTVGGLVGLVVTERRRRPRSWGLLVAACCYGAALVVWFAVVRPANVQVSSWSVNAVPATWAGWRARWEYGHAARFALMVVGYSSLVLTAQQRGLDRRASSSRTGADRGTVTGR